MHLPPTTILTAAALSLGIAFRSPGEWSGALFGWLGVALFAQTFSTESPPRWWRLLIYGVVAYLIGCPWLFRVVQFYTGTPLLLAAFLTGVGVFLAALQFVWLGILYRGLNISFLNTFSLGLPLAWLAAESTWPRVFSWELGASQLGFPAFIQIADIAGAAGPGFLMIWVCASFW